MPTAPPVRSASAWTSSLFLAVLACGIAFVGWHHEIGHDEAQAWNIARAATAPLDVVGLSLYEGHTPMWYLALWVVGRSGDPAAMQLLSAMLTLSFASLLLIDRPFGRLGTALLLVGYYPLYEYPIIARPYVLALLMCALFVTLYRRGGTSRDPFLPGLLCALIALTSAYGALLSLALMSIVVGYAGGWQSVLRDRSTATPALGRTIRRLAIPVTLWTSAAALSAWFVLTPFTGSEFTQVVASGARAWNGGSGAVLSAAALPHLDRLPAGIGAFFTTPHGNALRSVGAVLVAVAIGWRLRGDRVLVGAWAIALAGIVGGAWYSGLNSERHLGHLWLAAVTACWLGSRRRRAFLDKQPGRRADKPLPERSSFDRASRFIIGTALLWHGTIGLATAAYDVFRPMAPHELIASDIRKSVTTPYVLLTNYMYQIGGVVAELDQPAFDIRCNCFAFRYDWRWPPRDGPSATQLPAAACELSRTGKAVVLLGDARDAKAFPGATMVSEPRSGVRTDSPQPLGAWLVSSGTSGACGAGAS